MYVVGATMGYDDTSSSYSPPEGSIHPYIAKMDLETMEPLWFTQLEATYDATATTTSTTPTDAQAYGCAVHDTTVYVAGVVTDGAVMVMAGGKSFGNDDLFVAQLSAVSGTVHWVQQMGTSEKERMAPGGGLTVDPVTGHAIVLAQTKGDMYRRHRQQTAKPATRRRRRRKLGTTNNFNEVVLFSVASDGTFLEPGVEDTGQEDVPAALTPTNKQVPVAVQLIDADKLYHPHRPLVFWLIVSIIIGLIFCLFRCIHTKRKEGALARRTVDQDSSLPTTTNIAPGRRHSGSGIGSRPTLAASRFNNSYQFQSARAFQEDEDESAETVWFSPYGWRGDQSIPQSSTPLRRLTGRLSAVQVANTAEQEDNPMDESFWESISEELQLDDDSNTSGGSRLSSRASSLTPSDDDSHILLEDTLQLEQDDTSGCSRASDNDPCTLHFEDEDTAVFSTFRKSPFNVAVP
jgi:hypothetical protein